MNKFIFMLERLKKKDQYNGKGIRDIFRKVILKPGKKSSYIK